MMDQMDIEDQGNMFLSFRPEYSMDIDQLEPSDSDIELMDTDLDYDPAQEASFPNAMECDTQPKDLFSQTYNTMYTNNSTSSMEVNVSSSDDESMDWLSPWENNSLNCSSISLSTPIVSTTTSPQFSTWLPGSMSKLPLELVFDILDEILIGRTARLTHENLHALLKFRNISKHTKAMVSSYLQRDPILTYLQQQLHDWAHPHCAKWYRSHPDAFVELLQSSRRTSTVSNSDATETQPPGCDVITDIIVDDCPECFDSLGRAIPGLSDAHGGCNENGWTFVAIAIRAGSYRMLERLFLSALSPFSFTFDSPVLVLMASANCLQASPSSLGMLAYQNDPVFAERVLDLIGPVILTHHNAGIFKGAIFDSAEKELLCKYITPRTGEWLNHLGIQLWDPTGQSNLAWNAAVHNGPEFLEFLYRYDPSGIDRSLHAANGGLRPMYSAILANRLDSFRWILAKLQEKGLIYHESTIENAGYINALHCTSPESEMMLEDLLPSHVLCSSKQNAYVAGQFFTYIVTNLKEIVLAQAVRSDLDQWGFELFRYEHVQRAVRKCQAVSRYYFDTGLPMSAFDKVMADSMHFDAIEMAKQWRFEELVNIFYTYHGIPRLSTSGKY